MHKLYVIKFDQNADEDPDALIYENTLGGVPVWTRRSAGDYAGTLEGVAPNVNKIWSPSLLYRNGDGVLVEVAVGRLNPNALRITSTNLETGEPEDLFGSVDIEIRVYI
jgi:hypothetical protein